MRRIWLLGILGVFCSIHQATAATFRISAGDVAGLIAAIHAANDETAYPGPDKILLAEGTYALTVQDNDSDGPTGLPSITSEVVIRGRGADVTILTREAPLFAAPFFRLVHVAATGVLRLDGLTLSRGCTGANGAGIYTRGVLRVEASTLAENFAIVEEGTLGARRVGSGGGIYSASGEVVLRDSLLTGNFSEWGGGGGVMNLPGSRLILRQSTLTENYADYDGGISNGGEAVILASTLTAHVGSYTGALGNWGTMTIRDSVVQGNWSALESSALWNAGVLDMRDTLVQDNSGGELGTVSNVREGVMTIRDSAIRRNAWMYQGGGIYNTATLTLIRTTVTQNGAEEGGGLYNQGTLAATDVTVSDNTALTGGGLLNRGVLRRTRLTLTGNEPEDCVGC